MANVRIIYDDAAERVSSITAATSASGYDPITLKSNTKSLAHRSSSTSVTYTLTWSSAQSINGLILPATNLSSSATISVSVNGISSSSISACPNTTLDSYLGIKNLSSFPYGGLSKVAYWWPSLQSVTTLGITLTDTNRTSNATAIATGYAYPNYIDCSRIVCGKYWEPSIGVSKTGLELTINDTTQTSRSDTGDLFSDRGTIYDQLSFNLDVLTKTDREELIKLLKTVGNYKNLAVSIFPDLNSRTEQDYLIYGKRETSSISYLIHNYYSSNFSITGW
jgi:hypothetical protein